MKVDWRAFAFGSAALLAGDGDARDIVEAVIGIFPGTAYQQVFLFINKIGACVFAHFKIGRQLYGVGGAGFLTKAAENATGKIDPEIFGMPAAIGLGFLQTDAVHRAGDSAQVARHAPFLSIGIDLSDSIGYWNHFNVNDADDFAPLSFSKSARSIMYNINRARFFNALKYACVFPYKNHKIISLSDHIVYKTEPANDMDVFEIRNTHGDFLSLNQSGRISSEPGERVYLCKLKGDNNFYSFFQKSCDSIVISNDTGGLSSFCVIVEDTGDGHVSIRNPYEYNYLTSPPSHCDNKEVTFSAKKVLHWEKYTLEKIDYDGKAPYSSVSINSEISIDDFIHILRSNIGTMSVYDFCMCLAAVMDTDISTLKSCMRNLIPYT